MKVFYIKKNYIYWNFEKQQTVLKQVFFKVENTRTYSPLRAMFLILKHFDKENSEYPANVNYPDLPKQKKYFQT